jgi:type III secretory pathway component EscS
MKNKIYELFLDFKAGIIPVLLASAVGGLIAFIFKTLTLTKEQAFIVLGIILVLYFTTMMGGLRRLNK